MKKYTLFALLAVLIQLMSLNIFSQWIEWEKRKLRSYETRGFGIIQSSDGNIIISGTMYTGGFIYKSTQNADAIWTCLDASGNSLIEDNSGNIFSVFYDNYLFKLNGSGGLVWSKTITDSGYSGIRSMKIIKTFDDKIIIVGGANYQGNNSGYFTKLDLNGNKIWSNAIYAVNRNYYINNIYALNDGTFLAIGSVSGTNNYKIFISKIDQAGQIIFTYEFGNNDNQLKTAHNVFKQSDGGFLCFTSNHVSGNSKLVISKLDDSGNFLWDKIHGNNNYYISSSESIIKDRFRNQYIVAGSKPINNGFSDTNYCSLASYDSLGNLLWEKITYSDSFPSYFNGVTQIIDSSYVVCGDAFINYNTDILDSPDYLYILKTKKINPIGISTISSNLPSDFKLLQNYPNPFNPVTRIKFELPKAGQIEFAVYDILGRKIYSAFYNKPSGTYEIELDGSEYASGIYFYSLKTGEYIDTKKMIILK